MIAVGQLSIDHAKGFRGRIVVPAGAAQRAPVPIVANRVVQVSIGKAAARSSTPATSASMVPASAGAGPPGDNPVPKRMAASVESMFLQIGAGETGGKRRARACAGTGRNEDCPVSRSVLEPVSPYCGSPADAPSRTDLRIASCRIPRSRAMVPARRTLRSDRPTGTDVAFAQSFGASRRPSSISCPAMGSDGAPIIRSSARWFIGNRMTSRMFASSASSITMRSMPAAQPPWGGAP